MVAQRKRLRRLFGQAAQLQREPEEEELQMQDAPSMLQPKGPEKEELVQGKFEPTQTKPESNRTGMPDQLKAGIESLSEMDLSDVRVHANSDKPAEVNALAYTQGNDIHLAPGQEKHLPHEAWHAVQQKQGRVKPTMQDLGVIINDDKELEQEADMLSAKAMQMRSTKRSAIEFPVQPPAPIIQGVGWSDGVGMGISALSFRPNVRYGYGDYWVGHAASPKGHRSLPRPPLSGAK